MLAVAYPRRFHPSVAELKARIADGRLGILSHCQSEQTVPAGLSMRADYWRSSRAAGASVYSIRLSYLNEKLGLDTAEAERKPAPSKISFRSPI
jgi:predicted dehydrogenase